MILDTLNNIESYKFFKNGIYEGLVFLKEATRAIAVGEYNVATNVKAIVSEYETVSEFTRGYEAHQHVIDIQYPIIGTERVKWSNIDGMEINIPYDEKKDRTFYKKPKLRETLCDIGNGVFAIMFSNDGHSPQHYIYTPELIKKITIKVSI